ncbi:MAG: cysteine synthase A [Chloroflexi bacterium]|nr:cysteine synthase A [Chloroflexota bacterium]
MSLKYNGLNLNDGKCPIASNILETVGHTPLVRLNRLNLTSSVHILVKMESFNPAASVKDRLAIALIAEAQRKGLKDGGTMIIASSGNTGIGLAMACAALSYKCVITMPENMSLERRSLMHAFGAEIILTDAAEGMDGSIVKAEVLAAENNYILLNQFDSLYNASFHYKSTGPEIWRDSNGKVDIFVSGVGTGGTFSGVARYLKEKNRKLKAIAVEPADSAVLSGEQRGAHQIQGIGAGFIPPVLDKALIDEIIAVSNEDALQTTRRLAKEEGIFCGISAGAAVYAAIQTTQRVENKGKNIVVILPDTGEHYLTSGVF